MISTPHSSGTVGPIMGGLTRESTCTSVSLRNRLGERSHQQIKRTCDMSATGPSSSRRPRQRRDPTILDLAHAARVSKTTASRVLNGAPNVAPETRARVLEAIRRIDYRVNAAARSLRTTRTFLVGYLVPAVSNDVFGRIAEVLEEELRQQGVGLVIASSG